MEVVNMFSEREIQFLLQPHKLEFADRDGKRTLSAAKDLRSLGCPMAIFTGVLERRAKALGSKFAEFRNQQHAESVSAPVIDLESEIAAAKLW
jgi:hypothetical protein